MPRHTGTLSNGRKGTIVTTRENFSAPGANLTAEEWEAIFGKKKNRDYYRSKTSCSKHVIEEEWWGKDGARFYRKKIDGKVVKFTNESTGENIYADRSLEETC